MTFLRYWSIRIVVTVEMYFSRPDNYSLEAVSCNLSEIPHCPLLSHVDLSRLATAVLHTPLNRMNVLLLLTPYSHPFIPVCRKPPTEKPTAQPHQRTKSSGSSLQGVLGVVVVVTSCRNSLSE